VPGKEIRAAAKQHLPSTFLGHPDQRAYLRHLVPGWAQLKQQWFAGSRLHKGIAFSWRRQQHACVYAQIFVFVWWVLVVFVAQDRCRQMDSRSSGRFILGTWVVAHSLRQADSRGKSCSSACTCLLIKDFNVPARSKPTHLIIFSFHGSHKLVSVGVVWWKGKVFFLLRARSIIEPSA